MTTNDYSVRKVALADIASISDIWRLLEQGPDMTFFQSYEWNEMLCAYTPRGTAIECGFYLVEKGGRPMMIAPLWIVTRRRRLVNPPGVYMIGRSGYSDYLNLIYDRFDPEAMKALMAYVGSHYGVDTWHFEYLRDSALLTFIRKGIREGDLQMRSEAALTYCGVVLPDDVEQYEKSLSKKTRSNIRMASNRSRTDNVDLAVDFDDRNVDREELVRLREKWMSKKISRDRAGISLKGRIYLWLRHHLYERFLIAFPKYSPVTACPSTRILTIREKESGEIAAFFGYGVDEAHRTIEFVAASVNEKYRRYSPGLIGMKDFICHCIRRGNVGYVDFTRGNEQYKYWLGAANRDVYNLTVKAAR